MMEEVQQHNFFMQIECKFDNNENNMDSYYKCGLQQFEEHECTCDQRDLVAQKEEDTNLMQSWATCQYLTLDFKCIYFA